MYCLDRQPAADAEWTGAQTAIPEHWAGSLHYSQVDVTDTETLDSVITGIAEKEGRLDGLVAGECACSVLPHNSSTNWRGKII